jgi:DNA-binding NtrC family response regulator
MLSFFSQKKKPDFNPVKELTPEELDEIKFKARVAVVDDEEITHVRRLQNDGYNIAPLDDIKNIDDFLRKKYHVLILDIQGVGQHISPKSEGWGILKYLKAANPNLVIIMFTGAEWSITKYKDEADIADDFIGKDLEFLDFKAKLDNGIRKAFSPAYHFEIEKYKMLKEVSSLATIEQIKQAINNYGGDKKTAMKEIRKISSNKTVLESSERILSVIANLKQLFI